MLKDTVNDAASLDVSVLGKVELDELAKSTGVIVVHSLSVPKGLHDGAANKREQSSQPNLCKGLFDIFRCPTFVYYRELFTRCLTQNTIIYSDIFFFKFYLLLTTTKIKWLMRFI